MVTLNATILVQVVLFLAFLWIMNIIVFKPLLKVMDARESRLEGDSEKSQTEVVAAEELEREYASKTGELHRNASRKVAQAHRTANEQHNARVSELKQAQERELAETRAVAMAQVEEERKHYPKLTATLSAGMVERLGLGGSGS